MTSSRIVGLLPLLVACGGETAPAPLPPKITCESYNEACEGWARYGSNIFIVYARLIECAEDTGHCVAKRTDDECSAGCDPTFARDWCVAVCMSEQD